MKERVKTYLKERVSTWRGRWAMRGWRERLGMLFIPAATLAGLLIAIWLALWFFFGPPSVQIGDVTVDLDRSMSLAGPDKNANGIRDDIDEYIKALAEKKAYSAPQVKALEQDARATQGLVTVDLSNPRAIRAADNLDNLSVHCLFLKFNEKDAYQISKQSEKLTVNTKHRAVAYMKFNHAMNGTVSMSPSGDTCEP